MLIKQQKKDRKSLTALDWITLVALKINLNSFIVINISAWKNEEYGKQVVIKNAWLVRYNHYYFIEKKTMFLFFMRSGFILF